jgi:hypothetical protein
MTYLRTAAALVFLVCPMAAHAQLFGSPGLDPKFCEQSSFRQTVVYIDDMMMIEGRTEWAPKLADKLRATLAPGEHLTVVRLSPATGQSSELWSGCWPEYGDAERAAIAKETYFFKESPISQLNEQKKFFLQGFGGALATIYMATKRSSAATRFSANNPPTKQILRALASDEGRFANSHTTIRAIIYSDLAENSDLGSAFKPLSEQSTDYGQKLGSYLRRSVFYDFGVGEDVNDDASFQEHSKIFWSAAIRSMAATLGGIGTDLNVPNTLPSKAYNFQITVNYVDGQQLDGRLWLLTNADGDLVDSGIVISRLKSGLLRGTFRCEVDLTCNLNAETSGGITTTSPTDLVTLLGNGSTGLKGRIGVKGRADQPATMFELSATPSDKVTWEIKR